MEPAFIAAIATILVVGVWLLLNYRRSGVEAGSNSTALVQTAKILSLTATGRRASGSYRNHKLHMEALPPRNGKPGVSLSVTAKTPVNGDIRFSGPSENAGSGMPEVKIITGVGTFDYHYWILKSEPKDLAKTFFGAHVDLCEKLVKDVPFGVWHIQSRAMSYRGFDMENTPVATSPDLMVKVADTLVDIAEAAAG